MREDEVQVESCRSTIGNFLGEGHRVSSVVLLAGGGLKEMQMINQ